MPPEGESPEEPTALVDAESSTKTQLRRRSRRAPKSHPVFSLLLVVTVLVFLGTLGARIYFGLYVPEPTAGQDDTIRFIESFAIGTGSSLAGAFAAFGQQLFVYYAEDEDGDDD